MAYVGNNPEFNSEKLRFGYSSLTTPSSVFDYDMNTRKKELKKQDEVIGGHDPKKYINDECFWDEEELISMQLDEKHFN